MRARTRESAAAIPVPPTRGFLDGNRDSGSTRHGCTFDSGCCRPMRRRNSRPGRILDCPGAAAAVHRGLVADQHASRLARGHRLGGLYGSADISCPGCGRSRMASKGQPAPASRPGTRAPSPIGASLSFLFGRVGTLLGWRSAFVIAGIFGAAGVLIAWAALPRGDSGGEEESQPLLDFRPVLANRDVLALMVGYAAAIWGCVGLRQWIVVFLTFCAGDQSADPAQAWIILVVGALISFLGVPAGPSVNSAALPGILGLCSGSDHRAARNQASP
jgi:hypothetical protein